MSDFDENKHPRASDGKFTNGNGGNGGNNGDGGYSEGVNERIKWAKENGVDLPLNEDGSVNDLKLQELYEANHTKKKITPAEKIASVHIDFTRDNILPELNEEDLKELSVKKNKSVFLKKNVIDKNLHKHDDLSAEESNRMISEVLYSEKKVIIPSKYEDKPNYYTFAKIFRFSKKDGKPICGAVLLDVDSSKENFEIVHWHFIPQDRLSSLGPLKSNKKTPTEGLSIQRR